MVVSQRVTNCITAAKLCQIDNNNFQSVFVHITTKNNSIAAHHRTHAILCWLHQNNVPVQHYDNCNFIDGLAQEKIGSLATINEIIDHYQQKDKIIHSMTATLKPFASELSDCVIDRFLFLGSDVFPKQTRKQPRKKMIVPLPTLAIKTVAMFNRHTEFMQDVYQHIEVNKATSSPTQPMILSFEKTILPTNSALIETFADKLKNVQLLF